MIRVVAAIIEEGESRRLGAGRKTRPRLLICQRSWGQAFGGKWEFPGGKMRPAETPRAALRRELREELGIEVRVGAEVYRVRHRYDGMIQPLELTFFRAALRFGVPRNICFERICWVRRGDLAGYDFLAADRFLVNRLARGLW
jgi:mutator protein MutT